MKPENWCCMREPSYAIKSPPSDPDAAEAQRMRKAERSYGRLHTVVVIWLLGWVGFIVYKMVSLGAVERGLKWLIPGVIPATLLLLITVPLARLGSRIGKRERWRRYRLLLTFGLPVLLLLMPVARALKDRYFPQARFERLMGAEFPRDARVERCAFENGLVPFYGWYFTCELTCPAEETERLIREMKLEEMPVEGEPDRGRWVKFEGLQRSILVITDASRTKVKIIRLRGLSPQTCGVGG